MFYNIMQAGLTESVLEHKPLSGDLAVESDH